MAAETLIADGSMGPNDICMFVSVGVPSVAPGGNLAVFATSRPDLVTNRHVGQVWSVELANGQTRRLTRGVADTKPTISPSGSKVAFLRGDATGKPQIFIINATGGEPMQVTNAILGITEFAWAPDSVTLCYAGRVPEPGRYGSVPGSAAIAEPARRITGIRWTSDGLGYMADRPAQVFTIIVPEPDDEPNYASPDGVSGPAVQHTAGEGHHFNLAYSANGSEIYCCVEMVEERRRDLRSTLVAIPVMDGGQPRQVLGQEDGLAIRSFVVSGVDELAVLAHVTAADGIGSVPPDVGLWLCSTGETRRVTGQDTVDLAEVGSQISILGGRFVLQHRERGRLRLISVSREGEVNLLLGGDVEVTAHASGEGRLVAAISSPESQGELAVIDAAGTRTLTKFAGPLVGLGLLQSREVTILGRDGYPIHGWVTTPTGGGPHPVILQIHGGPYSSYGVRLSDERQVLAHAGYATVYCNPRGSAGYGLAHGRAVQHVLGSVDFADVIDFLDAVLESDSKLDPDRLGVMGGSYGGFIAAWATAWESRFTAAIVERGFLDPESFRGTSDIGSYFIDQYIGPTRSDTARQSAMEVVSQVRTPTLVIHPELDARCPLEQSTRYYSALKRNGVTAELLIFPGEHHGFGRSGQPRHRVQRLEAVLEWWQRWLPIGALTRDSAPSAGSIRSQP